jgi:glycosyl transferase, family 25
LKIKKPLKIKFSIAYNTAYNQKIIKNVSASPLPIYVLSVKTFTDRINHIQQEMAKHNLAFEFIFDHDVYDIDETTDERYFSVNSTLSPAAKSITLKHITAWQKAQFHNYEQILVLEDDIVLAPKFLQKLEKILTSARNLPPGYLIFLGGADTKVPKEFFKSQSDFYKLSIPTAEAYITDIAAVKARIAWLNENKIFLPADHAMVKIDHDCSISQYWPKKSIVTQGSVWGLFKTTLDTSRRKKSAFTNRVLFEWKKFTRRTLPQTSYNIINFFK